MSEASSDPTPSGPKETAWDSVSEKELDDVLSKAAAMAADLSGQLAAPDETAPRAGTNPLEGEAETLDRQLAQLGDLVTATANEVSEQGPAAESAAVPDFMAEFMSPPAPQPAGEPTAVDWQPAQEDALPPSPATPRAPGLTGIVGNPINIVIPSSASARSRDLAPAQASSTVTPDEDAEVDALGALAPLATALDWVDRPFAWAGGGLRKVIGVIAVLMLVASAVVWFWGAR